MMHVNMNGSSAACYWYHGDIYSVLEELVYKVLITIFFYIYHGRLYISQDTFIVLQVNIQNLKNLSSWRRLTMTYKGNYVLTPYFLPSQWACCKRS